MSKRNLEPIKKSDPEEEAKQFEDRGSNDVKSQRATRVRVGFRIPLQLKAKIYEESNRSGRSVTDIVVEQLSKRYE